MNVKAKLGMRKKLLANSYDVFMLIFFCAGMVYGFFSDAEIRQALCILLPAIGTGMVVRGVVKFGAVDSGSFVYKGEEYFVISKQVQTESSCESDSTASDAQNKADARAHCALAIRSVAEGDKDSAIRAYQRIEELDEDLAKELYGQIFD